MIDLSFLEKFTKGDTKKMRRYINLYLEVAPKTFIELQKSINTQNWQQLRIHAHSLKPQAEFMGITSLKNTLVAIEDAVKNKQYNNCEKLFNSALKLHQETQMLLKEKLNFLA